MSGQSQSQNMAYPEYVSIAQPDKLPYSDKLLSNEYLNRIVLASNDLLAILYRNIINSKLQTSQTLIARQEFHKKRLSKKCGEISSNSNQESHETSRILPEQNVILHGGSLLLYSFIVVHHIVLMFFLSDFRKKQMNMSSSKPSALFETEIARVGMLTHQKIASNTSGNGCEQVIAYHLRERYGDLIIWTTSVPLQSGFQFVDKILLLEQTITLQHHYQEVYASVLVIFFFIMTCGMLAHILARRLDFDVTTFLLVYDPNYIGELVRRRVLYYVDMMRQSYRNLWSIFKIDSMNLIAYRGNDYLSSRFYSSCCRSLDYDHHLANDLNWAPRRLTQTERDLGKLAYRLHCQGHPVDERQRMAIANLDLSDANYIHFQPSVRTQVWRRVTMLTIPWITLVLCICFSTALFGIFTKVIDESGPACERNEELKSFLKHGSQIDGLQELLASNCTLVGFDSTSATDDIRRKLGAHMSSAMRRADLSMFEESLSKFKTASSDWNDERLELTMAAEYLGPIEVPTLIEWSMSLLTVLVSGALFALYFTIYFSILFDLCYWLLELQLKLQVCKSILLQRNCFHLTLDAPKESTLDRGSTDVRFTSNFSYAQVFEYALASRSKRAEFCWNYAKSLISTDGIDLNTPISGLHESWKQPDGGRTISSIFLHTTYIDFRLFVDQIDQYRTPVNLIVGYTLLQGINIITTSRLVDTVKYKIIFILVGASLINFILFLASYFQSQCTKLIQPIYGILALGVDADKTVRHLISLWKRALTDATGSNTRFSFRAYSLNINYTVLLQFNLGLASLYIIALDKHQKSKQ